MSQLREVRDDSAWSRQLDNQIPSTRQPDPAYQTTRLTSAIRATPRDALGRQRHTRSRHATTEAPFYRGRQRPPRLREGRAHSIKCHRDRSEPILTAVGARSRRPNDFISSANTPERTRNGPHDPQPHERSSPRDALGRQRPERSTRESAEAPFYRKRPRPRRLREVGDFWRSTHFGHTF